MVPSPTWVVWVCGWDPSGGEMTIRPPSVVRARVGAADGSASPPWQPASASEAASTVAALRQQPRRHRPTSNVTVATGLSNSEVRRLTWTSQVPAEGITVSTA